MILEYLIILASATLTAFGQTRTACEAQLHHFTVHDYPPILKRVLPPNGPYGSGLPRPVYAKLPSRLLFSEQGVEVYANAPVVIIPSDFVDISVLIVYQSDAARKAEIDKLARSPLLPPKAFGALVTNLKYARIGFMPGTSEQWHISYIEFDQPSECENVFENDVHATLYNAYAHTTNQIAYSDRSKDLRLNVDQFPLYRRALHELMDWIERYNKVRSGT